MARSFRSTLLVIGLLVAPASATEVPDGFVHEALIGEPFTDWIVGFAFLPDGRFLLIESRTAVVRLAAAGAATADSIHTVPDAETAHIERGLLGVAVDPGWPARPYVYLNYTATSGFTKVVRLEATGDLADGASTNVALGNPYVLLDDIEDLNGIHNAGTLRFGPDELLYVATGDDARGCQAQDLASPLGKILRLDVANLPAGAGGPPAKSLLDPGTNPFTGPDYEPLVYEWGLRNPYRFTIDAPTGDLFIGSVGSHTYEEINHGPAATPGLNFGWPEFEGPDPIPCCGTCPLPVTYTFGIYDLPHPIDLISIVAGPRLRTSPATSVSFPPGYEGDYLFGELYSGDLVRLTESGGTWSIAPPAPGQADPARWGTGFVGISDLQLGPDGALYFSSLGTDFASLPRGLHRIRVEPDAVATPETGRPGDPLRVEPNPSRRGESVVLGRPAEPLTTLAVFDAQGRRVRVLPVGSSRPLEWDGRDDAGRLVAPGTYFLRGTAPDGAVRSGKLTRIP